ncbi:MAG: phosphate signaling complex protein PhoU [Phycisphaerales bacterium JB038]
MPADLIKELTQLRRGILGMGAAVEQRVRQAVEAMAHRSSEEARLVCDADAEINRMELDLEADCLRVLALYQPVAGDLRFVLAVMRINNELERVADLAASLTHRVIALADLKVEQMPAAILEMGRSAETMLREAISSLADESPEAARRIRLDDARVDALQKEIFAWAQQTIPAHVEYTDAAINILSISRKLERIADMATNIAEEVIFVCEGRIVRHEEC